MSLTRCSKCLLPSTRPDTAFVEETCSACVAYEQRKEIDWDARKDALIQILDRAAPNASGYDCIVPSSGGKDSFWQALTLLELGARPLAVTATTCHLTSIGRRNIDNMARYVDTVEITPNKTVRAKLNRLSLEMVGDLSWPEHTSIHTVPFRIAHQMGINLVFFGENPLNQYGAPSAEHQAEQRMTRRWVSEFGGFLGLRPMDFVGMEGITEKDMLAYCGPTDAQLNESGVEVYFLGQYLPWDSHANAEVAHEHGMVIPMMPPSRRNWWHAENLDSYQTGIHDFLMQAKYGYGRACAQMSVDIRRGDYTREDLVGKMEKMEGFYPEEYLDLSIDDILAPIGLTRERFDEIVEEYTACP